MERLSGGVLVWHLGGSGFYPWHNRETETCDTYGPPEEHPTQRGAKPCEDCISCTGLTTLARKKYRSPGTEGEGDTRGMGWLRAAGGGWGCWCDVALSRFSSFQLSPLVSSSSRGLVALSMSYRQSDTDQSIGSRGKAGGGAHQEARVKKEGARVVPVQPQKVPPLPGGGSTRL